MSHTREIHPSDLIAEEIDLVEKAEEEIFETFGIREEKSAAAPPGYFGILDKKAKAGVWVLRLGFGNNDDFSKLVDAYPGGIPPYQWILAKTSFCKKMLLVDDKNLLFLKAGDGRQKFLHTTDPERIREYKHYFEEELRIAGVIE